MTQFLSTRAGNTVTLHADIPMPQLRSSHIAADISSALINGQAARLGVPVDQILNREMSRAQVIDSRVTAEVLTDIHKLSMHAQQVFKQELLERAVAQEPHLRVLFAPTSRNIDHLIDGIGLSILLSGVLAKGQQKQLLELIDRGPSDLGIIWEKPTTPLELIASIVRWGVLTNHDKRRIRVDAPLREWSYQTLRDAGYDTRPRLGGISAVCTHFSGVLGLDPTMMALGRVPGEIPQHLPPSTKIIGSDPAAKQLAEIPLDPEFAGNLCILVQPGEFMLPAELSGLRVNGKKVIPKNVSKIDILVTGAGAPEGFEGLDARRMVAIGKQHDLLVLTGTKSLGTHEKIAEFLQRVCEIHAQDVSVALCYSETKFPMLEDEFWEALQTRACVEFFALNAFEARSVLERIRAAFVERKAFGISEKTFGRLEEALAIAREHPEKWEDGHESPEWLFESALLLQEILKIPIVRVRGAVADVVCTDAKLSFEPEKVRDHQFASRNCATVKVAHPRGLIGSVDELPLVENVPDGTHVAALFPIQDRISLYDAALSNGSAGSESATDAAEQFSKRCFAKLRDGRHVIVVSPTPFYSQTGGTQSAGDIMDFTFAALEALNLLKKAWELQPR